MGDDTEIYGSFLVGVGRKAEPNGTKENRKPNPHPQTPNNWKRGETGKNGGKRGGRASATAPSETTNHHPRPKPPPTPRPRPAQSRGSNHRKTRALRHQAKPQDTKSPPNHTWRGGRTPTGGGKTPVILNGGRAVAVNPKNDEPHDDGHDGNPRGNHHEPQHDEGERIEKPTHGQAPANDRKTDY
jgi:hypothetical protein